MCHGTGSGKLSQLVHYGPIAAISLILWITITAFHCLRQWFPPDLKHPLSIAHVILFWLWPVMIFYNFFRAMFVGPGFVPRRWKPVADEDEKYMQHCEICQGFKAPRAHHCKKCDRCVMKLDHHCPWINTCIGHFNQASFCWFMLTAILGCTHALAIIGSCLHRLLFAPYRHVRNEPRIHLSFAGMISSILTIGFGIGVVIALQFLLIIQLRNICQNRTAIEHWIIAKARERDHRRIEPFVFPFNLGLKENFRQVFNWSNNFRAIGDGLAWPVQAGCHLYALTQEQLHQAYEKNHSAVRYDVIKSYPGSWCPLSYGLPTCIFLPHFTETRIPIEQGDTVLVTRWKTYWLYGDRVTLTEDQRVRGWFPRSCISESLDTEDRQHKAPSKSRVKQSKKQH